MYEYKVVSDTIDSRLNSKLGREINRDGTWEFVAMCGTGTAVGASSTFPQNGPIVILFRRVMR
jgi:hypothetical protein